jgi:predicted GNAT family acetyltransferase
MVYSVYVTSIKTKIDPHETLPKIVLLQTDEEPSPNLPDSKRFELYSPEHQAAIGKALLIKMGENALGFRDIEIDKQYRGKGFGRAAYVRAIELAHQEGKAFQSDTFLTKDSKKMWDALTDQGIAEEIHPPVEMEPGFYLHSHYEIKPPENQRKK